jgi:hypothetical protein
MRGCDRHSDRRCSPSSFASSATAPGGEQAGEVAVVTAGDGGINWSIDRLFEQRKGDGLRPRIWARSTRMQVSLFGSKSMIGVQVFAGR